MKTLKLFALAFAVLAIAVMARPDAARAGGYADVGIVGPVYDYPPYGVHHVTHYRRHHYDYGRYWWYYDPYAYYGGYYGYHPRRFKPAYHKHRYYGQRYGYKKRWKRRHNRW